MRVTIKRLNARKRWRVEYRIGGKRFRPSFKTKELAEAEAERLRAEMASTGTAWASLSTPERIEVMTILREITAAKLTLRGVWEDHKRGVIGRGVKSDTLKDAYAKFIAEKETHRLSDRALAAYRSNVGRFIKGREGCPVTTITRDDVMGWLGQYTDTTFNSYLTSLNTFFLWCVGVEIITKSPVANIKKVSRRRMENADEAPRTLSPDELKTLLKITQETDPGLVPYVAACCFAGIRPEKEAPSLLSEDIGVQIHVRGRNAKDRQARFVDILPVLAEWLALPLPEPSQGPAGIGIDQFKNLRRRFEEVRLKAKLVRKEGDQLVGWEQDTMRHTFASFYLALYGAEKTVEALGHGNYDMLFNHYRKLMPREQAEKFLQLTPKTVSS